MTAPVFTHDALTAAGCEPERAEHQVVVVFDVTATDRLSAARAVVGVINGTRGRFTMPDRLIADSIVESWWFPEAELKQVDRNDNAAMHLEHDDDGLPDGLYVEDDAEDDPTIWLATDDPERPLALLSHCAFARLVGGDDHALPLWDRLTVGLPTSAPFCAEPSCDGETHYTGRRDPVTDEDVEAGPCPQAGAR